MSCEACRSALEDVALGAPAAPQVEAHLSGCESCRAALEQERRLLARIDGELASALDVSPPAELVARVRARRPATAWRLQPWRLASAAALLAGLATAHFLASPDAAAPRRPAVAAARPAPPPASYPEGPPLPPGRGAPRAPAARVSGPPRGAAEDPAPPAVLVPPDQEELVRHLAAVLEAGTLGPLPLPANAILVAAPRHEPAVAPIEVEPLRLDPIAFERLSLEATDDVPTKEGS